MKTRYWILIFCAVILLCTALWLLPKSGGDRAVVSVVGKPLLTLDLSADGQIPLDCGAVLLIENGTVCVLSNDCPDQVCVRHGILTRGGAPIVCLPKRLVIRWEKDRSGVDAVAGAMP